ncbi:MAG: SGNH/GDSL hydrolase family protein [Rubricoccaceae bacterium]|nr:SGNH/GDSL hydrolase family protein [Rubricoccaceae bacterium]
MSTPPVSFLALGDSYTIGEGVVYEERWPVQLVRRLSEQGFPVSDPNIIAKTGWTTAELQEGIDKHNPGTNFELVSLLIGVNNQYRGLASEAYRGEFRSLLQQAVGFGSGDASRVFVVSIPDWSVTPFAEGRNRVAIAKEVDLFNEINKSETDNAGVAYVNITPLSRTQGAMVVDDGLHPNAEVYRAWVDLICPVVKKMVASRRNSLN